VAGFIRILTLIFLLALVLIILFADRGTMPGFIYSLYSYPHGDSVGHFLLMGSFSFLANLSLACRTVKLNSKAVLLGSLLVGAVVTFEEFTQIFIPTRNFSLVDLSVDYLGIWAFGILAVLFGRKFFASLDYS
jgi:VanZ family protein